MVAEEQIKPVLLPVATFQSQWKNVFNDVSDNQRSYLVVNKDGNGLFTIRPYSAITDDEITVTASPKDLTDEFNARKIKAERSLFYRLTQGSVVYGSKDNKIAVLEATPAGPSQ